MEEQIAELARKLNENTDRKQPGSFLKEGQT